MNEVIKQRLVGALILVCLGVVFWPIIFVEPRDERAEPQRSMPVSPKVDTSPMVLPDVAGLRDSEPLPARDEAIAAADMLEAEPKAEIAEPAVLPNRPMAEETVAEAEPVAQGTRSEAPVKPEIDADGVPIAWMLQVASLSSEARARALRTELLALDQKAYVKRVRRDEKTLWRVYIGPKFEKALLEAAQPEVDKAVGVQSKIVRYYP